MPLYILKNKEAPWADYGDILLSGMTGHLERQNNLLQLERTGPFIPPVIISGIGDIIITNEIKKKISLSDISDISDISGIEFKPVIKKHIVDLDWTIWNFNSDEPDFYPDSGEPEDYILEKPHSSEIAEKLGDVWELVVKESGNIKNGCYMKGDEKLDILKAENQIVILVTQKAKDWFSENAGDWIQFEQIKIQSEK
ncbi:MAG: hypothetical protein IAF38_02405 [Bacteroidia bacterium]|nr:hypothetical protein [Bacteroidia bacterium]